MGSFTDLTAADGVRIPAYVARPAGQPRGGIVVIQEIFGVNTHIREVADGYAAEGYVAVAPALFQRVKPGVELGYTPADMEAGFAVMQAVEKLPAPGALADIQAAITQASPYLPPGMPTPPTYRKVNHADQPIFFLALKSSVLPHYRLRGGGRTQTARAGAGAFRRAGPVDSAAQHRRLPRAPPRGAGAPVPRAPRLQLQPPRGLERSSGQARARAHAGLLPPARGLRQR